MFAAARARVHKEDPGRNLFFFLLMPCALEALTVIKTSVIGQLFTSCQRKEIQASVANRGTLLDLCVSSLRRGHANLLCIVPILSDDEGNPGSWKEPTFHCKR